MSTKRAYSAYLSSMPADVPVVTANGFGAPQLQAQHPTPSSAAYLHVPGGWLQDHAIAAEEIRPPRASLFSTLGKWAATVSVVNLLSLPARLADRYLRRQTIKAIPIISSTGSSKKRFIAAGVADEEYATPSPSVRARANQTRRENQRQARASQSWNGSLHPHQFRDSPIQYTSPADVQDYESEIHDDYSEANISLDVDIDNANASLDVNVDFSFDNILASTPGSNYQTGSPINVFWDSPQVDSPASPTPSPQSYEHDYSSPACENAAPAWLFSHQSLAAHTSPDLAPPSAQRSASSNSTSGHSSQRAFKTPTVTPMRRQLLKVQLGNDIKRRQAALTESAEQGFTEAETTETSPTKVVNQDPSTTDASSYASPINEPHTNQLYHFPSETDGSPMQLDFVPAPPEFEYENDLSFLLDAPTPPCKKGVRWEKSAKCKPFYFDERVSEMLDSTLETITSSPIKNYYDVFHNAFRGAFDGSQTPSSPGSSAASSPRITLLDSPAKDGGWRGVSLDLFNAPDESLEESQPSLELFEELQRKLALASPPPPPPKPLVAPLSAEEEKILQDAAAKTNHGRNVSQWVIEEKLYARDFATLLPRDFNGDPRAWLNDNIVNEYLSILVAAKKKELGFAHKRNGPAPPLHAFSSFWYQTPDTSRWTNRFQLKGKQYLDAQLILYPICDKGHWRLLAVYPQERSIEYFDSMGLEGQKYIDHLLEYLEHELGEHWIPEEWNKETNQRSGQQVNGSDCGVFTLMNALTLIRGDGPDRVPITNGMDDARRRIAATLLAGQPTTELE
ncbi:hypothetical protein G6011_04595 [Alternaria panax]|uniref:Ubiquitin-like protease family profile domain-containing protein n=1 Tax=Alternaria panax TaxID=48097 RepID=A0AAD4NV27_9PLEO|nr:hypothetical protein G6011_04595 [Alternaria panax]